MNVFNAIISIISTAIVVYVSISIWRSERRNLKLADKRSRLNRLGLDMEKTFYDNRLAVIQGDDHQANITAARFTEMHEAYVQESNRL